MSADELLDLAEQLTPSLPADTEWVAELELPALRRDFADETAVTVGEGIPRGATPFRSPIVSLTYEQLSSVSRGTNFVSRCRMRIVCATVVLFALICTTSDAQAQPVRAYPEQLVKPGNGGRVINGCGPESLMVSSEKRFADDHSYTFGVDRGEYATYTVNFRDSCNLHDVGYQDAYFVQSSDGQWIRDPLVYNKIRGVDVQYANMSRAWVDQLFLIDMQTQCEQQIRQQTPSTTVGRLAPRSSQDRAIALCKEGRARTMYSLVRKLGRGAYQGTAARE